MLLILVMQMNKDIKERARHKAFAKISFLELENRTYIRDIKAGGAVRS